MAPQTAEPVPPGSNQIPSSPLRDNERPIWSRGGTLVRRPPVRHYIPKHPFYYTSNELFDTQYKTRVTYEEETKKFVSTTTGEDATEARRAFSAPTSRASKIRTTPRPSRQKDDHITRPKTSASSLRRAALIQQNRPEAVPWLSTPVPGMRTIEIYDMYRRAALDQKNTNVYHVKSGLLPKYMGYVPGLKFRYGSTFGMLTYNAKEVGVGRSATWGGAVSLF